jgi:hypothetical protein
MFVLGVSLAVIAYFGYNFYIFQKEQERRNDRFNQLAKNRIEYRKARMREMSETHKKTGIFREMAVDSIVKQNLIFDEKSGKYIRLTEID